MILRAKTKELLQTRELDNFKLDNSSLNLYELENNILNLESFPRRIVLEMTSACNINCVMCGRDNDNFINTYLDISVLDKLKNVLKYTEEVTLFGWGEPTIHPKFKDFLKILNDYSVRKYFVTNGMLLHKISDDIFKYNVDIIAVSLDGATAKTNNRIRVGSDYETIINNIKIIQEKKQLLNSIYPYMNFVFTAMKSNIHELPLMIELAKKCNLDEVKVVYLTVFNKDLLNETLYDEKLIVEKYFNEAIEISNKLNIKIKLPHLQNEDFEGKTNFHKPCFTSWRDLFIGSDGTIRPCQSTSYKITNHKVNSNFEDIWNCDEFIKFRSIVNNEEKMPIQCKLCYQSSHANWNNKNSFIQINTDFAPKWTKK